MTDHAIPKCVDGEQSTYLRSGRNEAAVDQEENLVRPAQEATSVEELRRIGLTWRERLHNLH